MPYDRFIEIMCTIIRGKNVVVFCLDKRHADNGFKDICRYLEKLKLPYKARLNNDTITIGNNTIRFVCSPHQLDGVKFNTVVIDEY